MSASVSDWRDPDSYSYTASLTRTGWAWEFLRRNPDFQAACAMRGAPSEGKEVPERPDLKPWGICFRQVAGDAVRGCACDLGPGVMRGRCSVDDDAPR